jgi:hypothetical protein
MRNRVTILALAATISSIAPTMAQRGAGPYAPTTESLRKHKVPLWFEDAKFGIFVHWGVFAVPAYHEWYVEFISPKAGFGFLFGGPPYNAARGNLPEDLYRARVREDAVQYHIANWGADFAYDDFIPMFKAEKFDPAAWADLFREAGARYVVLTAKHGDEFALWPTKFTPRNAMDMGPHRDLAGDLARSVRQAGLKMGFYHKASMLPETNNLRGVNRRNRHKRQHSDTALHAIALGTSHNPTATPPHRTPSKTPSTHYASPPPLFDRTCTGVPPFWGVAKAASTSDRT